MEIILLGTAGEYTWTGDYILGWEQRLAGYSTPVKYTQESLVNKSVVCVTIGDNTAGTAGEYTWTGDYILGREQRLTGYSTPVKYTQEIIVNEKKSISNAY